MRPNTRKWTALGTVGVALLGASWLGVWALRPTPTTPPTPGPVSPSEPAPEAKLPAVRRDPGCAFKLGDEVSYAIGSVASSTLDLGAMGGQVGEKSRMSRTTRATLDLRALSANSESAVLVGRYREIDEATKAAVGDGVNAPFLLRVDTRCEIKGYARLAATDVRDGRTQQAIAYELGFRWPDAKSEGPGASGFGQYAARFTYVPGARPIVQREIVSYTRIWAEEWARTVPSDQPAGAARAPKSSKMRVDMGAGPWFTSLTGSERPPSAAGVDSETTTTAQLVLTDKKQLDGAPTSESRYIWEDLLGRKVRPKVKEPPTKVERDLREVAKKMTMPEIIQSYESHVTPSGGGDIAKSWPLVTAYLESHPEKTTELVAKARHGEIADGAVAGFYVGVGRADTREAREALLGVMNDTSAPAIDRARSAFALVDRDDVGVALAQALHAEARGINTAPTFQARTWAREAALALGALSGLKGADDPAILQESQLAAREILDEGKTAGQLSPGFGLVANIGDTSLLSLVTPFTTSPDALIREAAVISIRRMKPELTGTMMASWLAREPDAEVRREIYHVVHLQTYDAQVVPNQAIIDRAIAELDADPRPGVMTRQSIYRLVGEASKRDPVLRSVLVAQARKEIDVKDEGLADLLAQYLQVEPEAPRGVAPTVRAASQGGE